MNAIAFSGKPRAGKDLATDRLCQLGYSKVQIAEPLYRVCEHLQRMFGRKVEKDRALLHSVGEKLKILRHENVWIDIAASAIAAAQAHSSGVVVSDCRFTCEYERLRQLGFKIVRIERSGYDGEDIEYYNHRCETELDGANFDLTLRNDGTIEEFISQIDALARRN
jgi:hypothetical protein